MRKLNQAGIKPYTADYIYYGTKYLLSDSQVDQKDGASIEKNYQLKHHLDLFKKLAFLFKK